MKELLQTYSEAFFARATLKVARDLLGANLNRRLGSGEVLTAIICEVEAYREDDPASHSYKGETERCRVMFGPPGRAYVYFIYGMYYCLNVVTEAAGTGGAVLIRGLLAEGLNGPGKICRQWQIDKNFNGVNLLDPASDLWLSKPQQALNHVVEVTPRIGISKATEKLWRFCIKQDESESVVYRQRKKSLR
ncbi:MAG: 3-methyladenine DNA glycosylase [Candidatus Melainabacteria bacterium]|nr:MAG: 3-methyladenine DNA glycosylase [Candidatus Melainabacteria bacterium]